MQTGATKKKNAALPKPVEKEPVKITPPKEEPENADDVVAEAVETPEKADGEKFQRDFLGTRVIIFDRFKSNDVETTRDDGWSSDKPYITKHIHRHFYNTKGRRGEDLVRTPYIYGHTHAITIEEDKSGKPVATCGPALVQSTKKTGKGKRSTVLVPKWIHNDPNKSEEEEGYRVMDTHTHVFEYTKSEKASIKNK